MHGGKNMIHTTLPYEFSEMEEIQKNGAIINMNEIHFPGKTNTFDIIRTSFIFIRNTGFDKIRLDFSETSYEFKRDILLQYIATDIKVVLDELIQTWLNILTKICFNDINDDLNETIFNIHEIETFINEDHSIVQMLVDFINSLPIFAMNYHMLLHNIDDIAINFETIDDSQLGPNIYNIIGYNQFNSLDAMVLGRPEKFFKKYFKSTNLDLYNAIKNHPGLGTLLAISNAQLEDIDSFEKEVCDIIQREKHV